MPTQQEKAQAFHQLHHKGNPLVLYNIWDPGTAKVAASAGAKALATGSWSVAEAFGFPDGEALPLDLAMENIKRIASTVDLPVSMDLEAGYGMTPDEVGSSIKRAGENGAIAVNFEDQIIGAKAGQDSLYSIEEQSKRIAVARKATESLGFKLFINARTDLFIQADAKADKRALLNQVIERGNAYHAAGADGFFVPLLQDADLIQELCEVCPLPVNIFLREGCPSIEELTKLGVARISHGPGPFRSAMALIERECKSLYQG